MTVNKNLFWFLFYIRHIFRAVEYGAIAQLARASRWQREGPGFESL